jgi:hypothetical protein
MGYPKLYHTGAWARLGHAPRHANIDWVRIELLHRELMISEREYLFVGKLIMNDVTKK